MRFRLIDRVDSFEAWSAIAGRKAVSFEEYSLLKPFGRFGVFPEDLVLGGCVELGRWLVAASSSFELIAILGEVRDFAVDARAGAGQLLEMAAEVTLRAEDHLDLECAVGCAAGPVARGSIGLVLLPAHGYYDCELLKAAWGELNGAP